MLGKGECKGEEREGHEREREGKRTEEVM